MSDYFAIKKLFINPSLRLRSNSRRGRSKSYLMRSREIRVELK